MVINLGGNGVKKFLVIVALLLCWQPAQAQVCLNNPWYGVVFVEALPPNPPNYPNPTYVSPGYWGSPTQTCEHLNLYVPAPGGGESCKDVGIWLHQITIPDLTCNPPESPRKGVTEVGLSINIDANTAEYFWNNVQPQGWTKTAEPLGSACGLPVNFTATRYVFSGPPIMDNGEWILIGAIRVCPVLRSGGSGVWNTIARFREASIWPGCSTYVERSNECGTERFEITSESTPWLPPGWPGGGPYGDCEEDADWDCTDFAVNNMRVITHVPSGSGGDGCPPGEQCLEKAEPPPTWSRVKGLYRD